MKAMTIGISPEYNYPGTINQWGENNTYYASNFGGSFITRAIMKEFNADYIDNFENISFLKNKYDTVIMALATHAHRDRDISFYTEILEKLDLKVIIISLGVSDYISDFVSYKLHPSVIKLLSIAKSSSNFIGVRGHYTAYVLKENGFKENVVPIGCPTLFWNMKKNIEINSKNNYSNPLIVYQENIVKDNFSLIDKKISLGQDFKDEVVFTDNLNDDKKLKEYQEIFYNSLSNKQDILKYIKKYGLFPKNFQEWFEIISKADFVLGPRLHGVICSLVQGIPAVLTVRDLRTKEMSEMFKIPSIYHKDLKKYSFDEITKNANYEDFINTYKIRYNNYNQFIKENNLHSNLEKENTNFFIYPKGDIDIILKIREESFISKKKTFISKLKNIILENKLTSFSIWGINDITIELLKELEGLNIKINYFIDSQKSINKETFLGQRIYNIKEISTDNTENILLISKMNAKKMIEYASREIDISKITFFKVSK